MTAPPPSHDSSGNPRLQIPLPLPHPFPETAWHLVTPELRETNPYFPKLEQAFLDACRRPGWNPKTVQMDGFMRAIDFCASPIDGSFRSYKTCIVADHPFLASLPSNAPRAVRHPYKADVRLRYALASDGWGFSGDMIRAEDAAIAFNAAASEART